MIFIMFLNTLRDMLYKKCKWNFLNKIFMQIFICGTKSKMIDVPVVVGSCRFFFYKKKCCDENIFFFSFYVWKFHSSLIGNKPSLFTQKDCTLFWFVVGTKKVSKTCIATVKISKVLPQKYQKTNFMKNFLLFI